LDPISWASKGSNLLHSHSFRAAYDVSRRINRLRLRAIRVFYIRSEIISENAPCWHSGWVQDRYTGDLGDYLKFGLLRWLAPPGVPTSPRLGVVWYRTADEADSNDGKYITYLKPGHRSAGYFRELDPDLYDRLAWVVANERSTAGLAAACLLGAGTCYFDDPLDFTGLSATAQAARQAKRRSWLQRAIAATVGCNLIFADPDNGIRTATNLVPAHRTKAIKYAYLDELAAFAERGQSLVVYHHADRSATVEEQVRRRLDDIARGVPIKPVAAVRASRGTTRLFLVAAAESQDGYLTERLAALTGSPWDKELQVYWA
jgi:hypothetical protein